MPRVAALLLLAAAAAADDSLVERWEKPRRESFALAGAPAAKAVEEIAKRYGIAFKADTKDLGAAGLAVESVTFFEALDRFAAAQGLFLVGVAGEARRCDQDPLSLVRVSRPLGATPVAYAGPSRLSVQGLWLVEPGDGDEPPRRVTRVFTAEGPRVGPAPLFTAWSDLHKEDEEEPGSLEDEEGPGSLRIVFKWMVEPGLEELTLLRLKLAAEDDASRVLRTVPPYPWDPPDVACAGLPLRANRNFLVAFDGPTPGARAIRKLDVKLTFALPVERGEIEFLAKDVGTTKRLGGCKVTLVEARDTLVRVAFDGTPCPEVVPTGTFASSDTGEVSVDQMALVAFDAVGRPVGHGSRCGGTSAGTSATYWTEWEEPPARFAVRAVTKVVLREASFSFAGIPLRE